MTTIAENQVGPLQLVLELQEAGALTPVSLTLDDPNMTYDRWEAMGRMFGQVERSNRFWLGDWIVFGEAVFGEEASQGTDDTPATRYDLANRVTGLAPETLKNLARLCSMISKDRRRAELPFSVHEPVAALDPDEQVVWLERAVQSGWTREELRQAIRDEKSPPQDDEVTVVDPEPPPESISARCERILGLVVQQGQPTTDGDYLVPAEVIVQARAALGLE